MIVSKPCGASRTRDGRPKGQPLAEQRGTTEKWRGLAPKSGLHHGGMSNRMAYGNRLSPCATKARTLHRSPCPGRWVDLIAHLLKDERKRAE